MKKTKTVFENLPASTPYDAALDKAMKLLAVAARTRYEIADRLSRVGFDQGTIEAVDERLVELGILDDDLLAADLAEKAVAKGQAPAAIRGMLLARGINRGTAQAAIAEVADPDQELARATELAKRRARTYGSLPRHVAYRRLSGFLANKGYDLELVGRVCRLVLDDPSEVD